MGQARNWTEYELDYLQSNWGDVCMTTMAKNLNRSLNAIKIKAQKIGLRRFIHSGDYITLNQLMLAIRGRTACSSDVLSFIERRGLPVKYKRAVQQRVRIIHLDDFWRWAEQNRTFIDFSKFEENALGAEPDWAKQQRRIDCQKAYVYKKTPWTPSEDDELRYLLSQYKYTYKEISDRICRTEGAIKRRLLDINIKMRPLKAQAEYWTDAEAQELLWLVGEGYSWEHISDKLGKSAMACRGKHERIQKPEYMREYKIARRSG